MPSSLPDEDTAVTRAQATLSETLHRPYRARHRGILTIRGKQYVVDGALTSSPGLGQRLAVISHLGLVAEVEINTQGAPRVLRSTPLLPEPWVRAYVVRDLRWLFSMPQNPTRAGRLADQRLVLTAPGDPSGLEAHYVFSPDGARWEELELSEGGRRIYHAARRRAGDATLSDTRAPSEILVDARRYRLHLRTVEFTLESASPDATVESRASEVRP
jgi:hypothetical protein